MNERDAALAERLDHTFPSPEVIPDWAGVRRDARAPRRRLAALAAVALLVVVGLLPALGVARGVLWYFVPVPRTEVKGEKIAVANSREGQLEFRAARDPALELIVYRNGEQVAVGTAADATSAGFDERSFVLPFGGPLANDESTRTQASQTQFAFGPIVDAVAHVEVVLDDGDVRAATIVNGPEGLGRFYYTALPRKPLIVTVRAKASGGVTLQEARCCFGASVRKYRRVDAP
jgi:hypothetical protein